MISLFLRSRLRRIFALIGFAMLFIAAGLVARMMVGTNDGHVELGQLFAVGGYALVSTLLLLGWMLGRYPLIATLVLFAGIVSEDRLNGMSRLYSVRPTSLARIYLLRYLVAAAIAFVLSAALLPFFDLMLLGQWAGPATLILIISYIAVYGSLSFFLSIWVRSEVWIALVLSIAAMLWDALLRSGKIGNSAPGIRQAVAIILPPQGALFRLESAFGSVQPIPWDSFAYVMAYAAILFVAGAVSLRIREY
ncbi:MAG TPA: hypothetical protein VM100_04535 [Longimicrobiales bacterium]|nr:hypothetical protein [Longimicrobiales bacterium]